MKIAILGTGMVGKAHASRLTELGHQVVMGTQNVEAKKVEQTPDNSGQTFNDWHQQNPDVELITLMEAAQIGELIINALSGQVSVEALKKLEAQIGEKILIDIANPLDFSQGMPPTLTVCNTDSLGEQIQAALPKAKVVKTCNTTNADVQVKPQELAEGDHHIFMSGNDEEAKNKVTDLLQSYGWQNIIDLGDITTARGTEMFLPLWIRLFGKYGHSKFNIKVVK
ncbi:NAD(P)-binding domain-containing protein [Candidatus Berkelbacteria bacterium]|nr:NAD(P)-binding domain-containing protein [Candidatus Berkelbacteria bacterium]